MKINTKILKGLNQSTSGSISFSDAKSFLLQIYRAVAGIDLDFGGIQCRGFGRPERRIFYIEF